MRCNSDSILCSTELLQISHIRRPVGAVPEQTNFRESMNLVSEMIDCPRTPVALWMATLCKNGFDLITSQNLLQPPRYKFETLFSVLRRPRESMKARTSFVPAVESLELLAVRTDTAKRSKRLSRVPEKEVSGSTSWVMFDFSFLLDSHHHIFLLNYLCEGYSSSY